jgi:hypothetical protein
VYAGVAVRQVGSRIEAGRPLHRAWEALSSTRMMFVTLEKGQVALVHPEREGMPPHPTRARLGGKNTSAFDERFSAPRACQPAAVAVGR